MNDTNWDAIISKTKTFFYIAAFPKSRWSFEHFEKKGDPYRFCISEIADSENVVREMSEKSPFRQPLDKQHGKRAPALFKSAPQHLYHIHWSLQSKLTWKKSLLLTCQILRLLFNILPADEKYPVLNRDNLTIPIQMQLSQKEIFFSQFLGAFLKSRLNFKYLDQKMTLIDFVFPKILTPKTWSDKCLKSPVSEDHSMLNVSNHYINLHDNIFIIFVDHCQVNWVGKSLCFLHTQSWDCLLTHMLPMESILFLLETI